MFRTWVVDLPAPASGLEALARTLEQSPGVELCEPDPIGFAGGTPDDPEFPDQWALSQASDADIDAPEAWEALPSLPLEAVVLVAVLDSGIDRQHTDLRRHFVDGYDFVDDDETPEDLVGHGTHVAGIIAAEHNNGFGIAGVCDRCRVLAARVLDQDLFGRYSDWAEAIVWATDNGAQVINMSLGGVQPNDTLQEAVRYASERGVVLVAAMMNDGNTVPYYPAAYPEVIAVGATDSDDRRAVRFPSGGGSSYGAHIDLIAPGVRIQGLGIGDTLTAWSGTSQATAHVSGAAALLILARPELSSAEQRALLEAAADDLVGAPLEDAPGLDPFHGHGRLNAANPLPSRPPTKPTEDPEPPDDTQTLDAEPYPPAPEEPSDCACTVRKQPEISGITWGFALLLLLRLMRRRGGAERDLVLRSKLSKKSQ